MENSNVLVVGPRGALGKDFGAAFVANFTEARRYLQTHKPAVLVFGSVRAAEFDKFCQFALEHSPDSLWIVACDRLSPSTLIKWNNNGRLHDLVENLEDSELEQKMQQALETAGSEAQRRKLVELFEDQSHQLKRLSSDLEARVQKRHKTLRKSLAKNEETKGRMEAFHRALLGIHRASTILQMEQTLNDALKDSMDLVGVRIRFEAQSSMLAQNPRPHVLAIELPRRFDNLRGEVWFAKKDGQAFTGEESDFLHELSEGLALALARLQKLELAETLKGEWQATFDAIPHPLCLVTGDQEILKLNRAFRQQALKNPDGSFHSLLGKNCFITFFGHEFRQPARLESPFSFRHARIGPHGHEHFEVSGQPLGLTHDNQTVQLVLIRSITDEVRYERRILDASKLAELGTIGSSIAHELNNPLGGMLSFLQLILMDLKKSDPLFSDIKAMEEATLRCRDIILNLLSFARKQDLGEFTETDLWEVFEKAVKLIELQSKSQGLRIDYERAQPLLVRASPNALAQALCNLLQNAMDAIAERQKIESLYNGVIRVSVETDGDNYRLKISDNGTGIAPEVLSRIFNPHFTTRNPGEHRGNGLTTAFTIVSEHSGHLEMLSQTGSGTSAIVTLPRLD
jgi:signal transduction histidine kinase